MRRALSLLIFLLIAAPALARGGAKQRLENSPLRRERVAVENGDRTAHAPEEDLNSMNAQGTIETPDISAPSTHNQR